MKILQVLQFFSPSFGGTVTTLYDLSKELVKLGHEVTVITTDFKLDHDYVKSIEKEGVKVISFKCTFHFASFLYSPSMKKWLNSNLKDYDIVHMHNFRTYQNNITRKYSMKFGIPYVLQAHGSVLPFFQKQFLKKIYDHLWGNNLLRDSKSLFALNESEADQYKKMGGIKTQIEILPNGIDLTEFVCLPNRGVLRKKYSISDDEKIILFLGRINKIKGIDLLIESFLELSSKFNKIKLIVVGPDDGYQSELQTKFKLKNNNIIFTGPLYGEKKLNAFADSDLFVLPSVYETFPVSALESCACGVPVILSDACFITDLIDGKVGLIVDDKESLKNAICEILTSEQLKSSFSKNAKELAKKFDWGNIALLFVEKYETIIKIKE